VEKWKKQGFPQGMREGFWELWDSAASAACADGRGASVFFEGPREGGQTAEAAGKCDFGQGALRGKELFGAGEAIAEQIFMKAHAGELPEQSAEVRNAQAGVFGGLSDRQSFLRVMLADEIEGIGQR